MGKFIKNLEVFYASNATQVFLSSHTTSKKQIQGNEGDVLWEPFMKERACAISVVCRLTPEKRPWPFTKYSQLIYVYKLT